MSKAIVKAITNVKPGVYTRVMYKTDMTSKLSAASRKQGYSVEKITETTCRVGCNYNHMASVKEKRRRGELGIAKTNPYEWVIKDRIKRHAERGTEYMVLGTVPIPNAKTMYVIYHGMDTPIVREKLTDEDKNLFIPSAFNGSGDVPEVLSIKLENVMKFNGVTA